MTVLSANVQVNGRTEVRDTGAYSPVSLRDIFDRVRADVT